MGKSNLFILGLATIALGLSACTETGSSVAAVANTEAAENQPRYEKKVAARKTDGKLVCKKKSRTGSRLGNTEICYTQEEWDRKAELARDDHRRTTNNSASSVE